MIPDDFDDDFLEDDGNYVNDGNFNDDDFAIWDRNTIFNSDGTAVDQDGVPLDDKYAYRNQDEDFYHENEESEDFEDNDGE